MATLQELQETAKARTEAVIGAWTDNPTGQTRKLLSNYQTAYNNIDKQIKDAYAKHLVGISPEDLGYYNEMLKLDRLEKLQKQIAKSYNTAALKAGFAQVEISKTGISNENYQDMYSVNWFTGSQKSQYFSILNPKTIEASVFSTPKIWKSIRPNLRERFQAYFAKHGDLPTTLKNARTKDLIKLNQAITQALINGDSYQVLSKEIKKILNTTASNATKIARTEGIRNMNSGSYANTQAAMDAGVDVGREVVEVTTGDVREQSLAINGQKQPGVKPFNYPGGLKVDIIGNSGVAKWDINERGSSVDFVAGNDTNNTKGINPVTGKHSTADMREFNKWMEDNDLKYSDTGRIISKGKTAF